MKIRKISNAENSQNFQFGKFKKFPKFYNFKNRISESIQFRKIAHFQNVTIWETQNSINSPFYKFGAFDIKIKNNFVNKKIESYISFFWYFKFRNSEISVVLYLVVPNVDSQT